MNQFGYSATQVANILKHLSAIIFLLRYFHSAVAAGFESVSFSQYVCFFFGSFFRLATSFPFLLPVFLLALLPARFAFTFTYIRLETIETI